MQTTCFKLLVNGRRDSRDDLVKNTFSEEAGVTTVKL